MHYLERALIDHLPTLWPGIQSGVLDGVWFWDLCSPEHEWMSPRFWHVLGYDPATMPHSPDAWRSLIHPEDLPRALADFDKHLADPGFEYKMIVRYKAGPLREVAGGWVWVRCRGEVVRIDDQPAYMVGCHTDLTTEMVQLANLEGRLSALEIQADITEEVSLG